MTPRKRSAQHVGGQTAFTRSGRMLLDVMVGPRRVAWGARVEATHLADVVDGCGHCWRRLDITLKKPGAGVGGVTRKRWGGPLPGDQA